MKLRTLSLMLAAAALPALLGGCAKAYSKDGQSVTIKVDPAKAGGAEKVRLQVLGPKIIRHPDGRLCRRRKPRGA